MHDGKFVDAGKLNNQIAYCEFPLIIPPDETIEDVLGCTYKEYPKLVKNLSLCTLETYELTPVKESE